jgi:polyisoprenoid-binding protein YceI
VWRLRTCLAACFAHTRAKRVRRPFAAWLLPLLPLLPVQTPPSMSYRIDGANSQAVFGVRLLWLHEISGRFRHIDGAVLAGPTDDTVVVRANIAVDSVMMDSSRMRRWVLAPDFFDAAEYPFIRFVSDPLPWTTLKQGGPLPGRLSLRGVTAPMSFMLHPLYCTGSSPVSCRISLNGTIQRGDFGMVAHRAALSDRVELNLAITLRPVTPSHGDNPPHAAKKP